MQIRAHTAAIAVMTTAAALAFAGPASALSVGGPAATPPQSEALSPWSSQAASEADLVLTKLVAFGDDDVWAAGSEPYPNYVPALEHWNGTRWRRATLDLPVGAQEGSLDDLAAVSPTDIYAVGHWSKLVGYEDSHPLLEHWNGHHWSLMDIDASGVFNLGAVSVRSPRRVYLIGDTATGEQPAVFVGHGRSFQRRSPSSPAGWVGRVAATSPMDAWSAGLRGAPDYPYRLLEHWNGAHWTDESPDFVKRADVASDIAMASTDSVWVCGFVADREGGPARALLFHYDGTAWHNLSPARRKARFYNAVSFSQPDDGWLAGEGKRIEHYDGTSWTSVPLPIAKTGVLRDVEALSPTDAWAVGHGTSGTVVLRWDGAVWTKIAAL